MSSVTLFNRSSKGVPKVVPALSRSAILKLRLSPLLTLLRSGTKLVNVASPNSSFPILIVYGPRPEVPVKSKLKSVASSQIV